jgi:Fe-S-cluster containining protein
VKLGIPADRFLAQYTIPANADYNSPYPMVRLRMNESEAGQCPFLSPYGCSVYEDRPGACRLYPVGRAFTAVEGEEKGREKFFIVRESHCLGLKEKRFWTLKEWIKHEGAEQYNEINDQWLSIVTSPRSPGKGDLLKRKMQMFFMASYNLDRLRDFFFESSFFSQFLVSEKRQRALREDDLELLKFGFLWLRFSLFSEKTIPLRQSEMSK